MTKDEALGLALEALQDYVDEYGPWSDDSGARYVLRVGREALAQSEPVSFSCLRCVTPKKCAIHGCSPNTWPSETPPQRTWVGLTDEDIKPFCDANHIIFGAYTIDFVRAIEAKLKQKNEQ